MASNFQQFFGGGSGLTTQLEGTFKYPVSAGKGVTLESDGEFGLSFELLSSQLGVQASPGDYSYIPVFSVKLSNGNNLVLYSRDVTAQQARYAVFNEDFTSVVRSPTGVPHGNFYMRNYPSSFAYDPVNNTLGYVMADGNTYVQIGFWQFDVGTNSFSNLASAVTVTLGAIASGSICFDSVRNKFIALVYVVSGSGQSTIVTYDSTTGAEDGRVTSTKGAAGGGYYSGYIAYDPVNDCVYTIHDASGSTWYFRKYSWNAGNTRYEEDGSEYSASSGSNRNIAERHVSNAYVVNNELVWMSSRTNNFYYINTLTVDGSGFTGGINVYFTDSTYSSSTSIIVPYGNKVLYLGDDSKLHIYTPGVGTSQKVYVTEYLKLSSSFPVVLAPGEDKIILSEVNTSASPDRVNHYVFSGVGAFLSSGLKIGKAANDILNANDVGDVVLDAEFIGLLVGADNSTINKGTKKDDGALVVSNTQDLKPLTPPAKKKKIYISNPAGIGNSGATTIFSASGFSGKIIGIGLIPYTTSPTFVSLTQTIDSFSEESMGVTSLFASSSSSLPLGNSSSGFGPGVIPASIDFENAITIKGQLTSSQSGSAFLVIEVDREVNPS